MSSLYVRSLILLVYNGKTFTKENIFVIRTHVTMRDNRLCRLPEFQTVNKYKPDNGGYFRCQISILLRKSGQCYTTYRALY